MNALRTWLSRPAGEHPWLVVALVVAVGVVAVVTLVAGGLDDSDSRPAGERTSSAPPAVIGRVPSAELPARAADDGDAARPVARAFLISYLAFLYGRAEAQEVRHVTGPVRRELAANRPRVPPALRQRRPRVIDLRLTRQAADAVLATANVDDGDIAVYPIVFTLDRTDSGEWRVSRLAND